MKRIAIVQSCYIPWRGSFDLMSRCDEYVIYDSAALRKGHWHNRNLIKTENGPRWLTIPLRTAGRLGQKIMDTEIAAPWADRHWAAIERAYRRAPFFDAEAAALNALYREATAMGRLSQVNTLFLRALAKRLGIRTSIVTDSVYESAGRRDERVLSICLAAGATHYLSGPSAKTYLDERRFRESGVHVEWIDYGGYAEYPQLYGRFIGQLSVIDLLFNAGPDAGRLFSPRAESREA